MRNLNILSTVITAFLLLCVTTAFSQDTTSRSSQDSLDLKLENAEKEIENMARRLEILLTKLGEKTSEHIEREVTREVKEAMKELERELEELDRELEEEIDEERREKEEDRRERREEVEKEIEEKVISKFDKRSNQIMLFMANLLKTFLKVEGSDYLHQEICL